MCRKSEKDSRKACHKRRATAAFSGVILIRAARRCPCAGARMVRNRSRTLCRIPLNRVGSDKGRGNRQISCKLHSRSQYINSAPLSATSALSNISVTVRRRSHQCAKCHPDNSTWYQPSLQAPSSKLEGLRLLRCSRSPVGLCLDRTTSRAYVKGSHRVPPYN